MRFLAFVIVLFVAPLVSAQELPSVPDVTLPEIGETAALEQGQRAPWAGMLVRDADLFELQSGLMAARLQLENARSLYAEALLSRDRLLAAALAAGDERVELHTSLWRSQSERLAEELQASRSREGPAWHQEPALWFSIGVLATVAAVVAIFVATGT